MGPRDWDISHLWDVLLEDEDQNKRTEPKSMFTVSDREGISRNNINFERRKCSTCEPKENVMRCQLMSQRNFTSSDQIRTRIPKMMIRNQEYNKEPAMESNSKGLTEMTRMW
ncbi:hypothetical protein TNIN_101 [Trichonephila inaurata madagascariensis]|uniref:Uncharacterized protein n=1 Tax=Trichonephila inaurata madagascariensis TaxID=2747483 RepID=A0A8X7BYD2_9ARAC|nr:hypothetical protein TNIN_101 [Trichonephila inaurata madagascariensis]